MKCHYCKQEMWDAMIGAGNCVNKKCKAYLFCQTSQEYVDECTRINKEFYEKEKNRKWWQL
jgi:hypothetical protein